jgi:hypothetical protein
MFPIELVDAHGSEGEDFELYFNDKKKENPNIKVYYIMH